MTSLHILVMAKSPMAGRVKTRLCPPCTFAGAAELAEAALADTLAAVASVGVERGVVALDGPVGSWLPEGFEVIPQRGFGLAERLANAWSDVAGPGIQIGMDTPQVTPALLATSLEALLANDVDAVLGDANDGGWWALGLRSSAPRAFDGVPMSEPTTGRHQRRRLQELGLRVATLPTLTDVDTIDDAMVVAAVAPDTSFARTLHAQLAGVR